jgi:methyltransferase (TIGR00027 family)
MSELLGVHMTALGAAAMRARHLIVDGEPKILRDTFAQRLIGLDDDQIVALTNGIAQMNGIAYNVWVQRARFAEDRLAQALALGVRQYVVLGAGLDSYALRQPRVLNDLSIFEVDDAPLQNWKRNRFKELGIEPPINLRFAPCDFEVTPIADALESAGFDRFAPAVVSWLGVTQYLTRPAITKTLLWAASMAPGSEIVLGYVVPGEEAERHKALLAARGTRFETFFTPEEISDVLAKTGWVDLFQLTPEQAHATYFAGRSDGLVASHVEQFVVAKTK